MDPTRARAPDLADLATARALITALQEQLATSQQEVMSLRHQLDVLCQRLFGKKSERVDPRQLQLALEQLANESGPVTDPIEMDSGETPVREHARRRPTGRRPLPAHLPRRRVEIDVPDADKTCGCGHARTRIGETITSKLEYEPASFVVIETARAEVRVPALSCRRRGSARSAASRREVARGRGPPRARGRVEVCRPPPVASARRHLYPRGDRLSRGPRCVTGWRPSPPR